MIHGWEGEGVIYAKEAGLAMNIATSPLCSIIDHTLSFPLNVTLL